MSRWFRLASLAALLPLAGGCDLIADIAGAPDEVDVSTGSAGRLLLVPDGTTVTRSDVNVGRDLPNVFDVDALVLPPGSVTFTPAASRSGGTEVCTVALGVFIDDVRAAAGQARVEVDGATATVTEASVTFAEGYSSADVCDAFPSGECPAASGTYTRSQIAEAVTQAVQSGAFELSISGENDGPCAGQLEVQTLRFGLNY